MNEPAGAKQEVTGGVEYRLRPLQGKRERLDVILYTEDHKIVGTVHIMPGSRLVDYLNHRAEGTFIAVTDAQVYSMPSEELKHSPAFLAINRSAVTMALPTHESPRFGVPIQLNR